MDSHARFNLSPVPSVEGDDDDDDDDDDGVGHQTHRGLAKIDQDDSGEEIEHPADLHTGTTAVQLLDTNNGPTSLTTESSNDQNHGLFVCFDR